MTSQKFLYALVALMTCTILSTSLPAQTKGPQITSLSASTLDRSGRLLIFGAGFGTTQGTGQVTIGGHRAIVTTWLDTEIHAYVPEKTSVGTVPVRVVSASGLSNTETLNVTLRQSAVAAGTGSRIRWRFQIDSTFGGEFEAVAPDGTVYVSDLFRLYALSPDGGLLWVALNAGRRRPIGLGADGTIYAAGNPVKAFNPDGTLRWEFSNPGFDLLAGPNVGPDGNIYAVQDTNFGGGGGGQGELGAFSLDPSGNLLWADQGQSGTASTNGNNAEIVFGTDRFFTGIKATTGTPTLWSFGLDGNLLWNGSTSDLNLGSRNFPRLDPTGRVIAAWGQTAIQAITPDGGVDWISFHPEGANLMMMPGFDANGVIYTSGWFGRLWAINPDGSALWSLPNSGGILDALNVPPDGSLILTGGTDTFGQPGWVQAHDTADGAFLWQVDLLSEGGFNQRVNSLQPTFTPDSQTAYVTTVFLGNTGISYLYAIRVGDLVAPIPGDINGNGVVNIDDLVMVLNAFGPCPAPPASCAADIAPAGPPMGNGVVNIDDLVAVLNAFGA